MGTDFLSKVHMVTTTVPPLSPMSRPSTAKLPNTQAFTCWSKAILLCLKFAFSSQSFNQTDTNWEVALITSREEVSLQTECNTATVRVTIKFSCQRPCVRIRKRASETNRYGRPRQMGTGVRDKWERAYDKFRTGV